MPIFEYVCNDCQAKFEKIVRRPDESTACPRCGGPEITLQFSIFGFNAGQENGAMFVGSRAGGCGCGSGGCACCRS